eukprot:s979_g3.t1
MNGAEEEYGSPTQAGAAGGQEAQGAVRTGGATGGQGSSPLYDGIDPETTFQQYEKNVRLWQYETDVLPRKQGVKLMRSLSGLARLAVEDMEFEAIACEDGARNVMGKLKEYFLPHLEVYLPRAFEAAVYGASRSQKESFAEYVHRMDRAFTRLSREGVVLPKGAIGYILYRQASLTEARDQRVLTWIEGKYERESPSSRR